MKKCDFCTQSSPSGKCPWSMTSAREPYCRSALKRMTKAFGKNSKGKAGKTR